MWRDWIEAANDQQLIAACRWVARALDERDPLEDRLLTIGGNLAAAPSTNNRVEARRLVESGLIAWDAASKRLGGNGIATFESWIRETYGAARPAAGPPRAPAPAADAPKPGARPTYLLPLAIVGGLLVIGAAT